jgi:citrate lyase subunit beta / citryl-CoA lyase
VATMHTTPANTGLPTWRSLLFCPANNPKFVARAHTRGADAIILDLEDSVPAAEKNAARASVAASARAIRGGGPDVCVRINRPIDAAVMDIEAAVSEAVTALVLPKVLGSDHVRLLAELTGTHEIARGLPLGHTRFIVLIETAAALAKMGEIATADPRVVALNVGSEDLSTDLDAEPSADSLYVAKMLGIHAARAAGILPMGMLSTVASIAGSDDYRQMLRRSRRLGFACAACVHPDQVVLVNEEYGPKPAELDRARRLIAAFEQSAAQGRGAVSFEGMMVDPPVVERARRLVERAAARSASEDHAGRKTPERS